MNMTAVFALFLAALVLLVGIILFPTVKAVLDGVDMTGWDSFMQSYVGMFFLIFLALLGLCAISVFFKGRG